MPPDDFLPWGVVDKIRKNEQWLAVSPSLPAFVLESVIAPIQVDRNCSFLYDVYIKMKRKVVIKVRFKRGDICIAQMPEPVGCEQSSRKPVLIIQNNIGNRYSPMAIVAAITRRKKPNMSAYVELTGENGIADNSIVLLEQIKTIDKVRLCKRIGHLDADVMKQVDGCLECRVGLTENCPLEMTLCPKCLTQFRADPKNRVWRIDQNQQYKETCTYCGVRSGFDYCLLRII